MDAAETAPVREGDLLAGKYRVERVIGVGGMGVVVAARHLHLDVRVALKFLLPSLKQDGEIVARFLREGQAAARIKSEHVGRIMDVGSFDDGSPYLVMEYLEGRDLAAELASRGRLSVAEAVAHVLQALEALAEAHQSGIVHRDLKPSNLFLTRRADGSALIKVLDFGISKAAFGEGGEAVLTRSQGIMGSPQYMSPEQIRSAKRVDQRSDIWSTGVILHELVTGTPPFRSDNVGGILASIVADPPSSPSTLQPGLPPAFDAVIARCLQKSPEARFQTVAELAVALAQFGGTQAALSVSRISGVGGGGATLLSPSTATPAGNPRAVSAPEAGTVSPWSSTRSPKRGRAFLFTAIGAAVCLAGGGVWLASRSSSELDAEVVASPGSVPVATTTPAPTGSAPPEVLPALTPLTPPSADAVPPALPSSSVRAVPAAPPARRPPQTVKPKSTAVVLPDDRN